MFVIYAPAEFVPRLVLRRRDSCATADEVAFCVAARSCSSTFEGSTNVNEMTDGHVYFSWFELFCQGL